MDTYYYNRYNIIPTVNRENSISLFTYLLYNNIGLKGTKTFLDVIVFSPRPLHEHIAS